MGLRDLGALDQAQLDSPEWAAARHVLAVVGGTAEINDTNAEDGQFDVLIVSEDGRSIALEATSFGGDQWKQTHSRIRKQTHEGVLDGNDLRWQWEVVVPTGSDIRRVSRSVEALLRDAEAVGVDSLSQRYRGDDEALAALAARLIKEGIEEAWVWEKAPRKVSREYSCTKAGKTLGRQVRFRPRSRLSSRRSPTTRRSFGARRATNTICTSFWRTEERQQSSKVSGRFQHVRLIRQTSSTACGSTRLLCRATSSA